jgi:hypothetical protein
MKSKEEIEQLAEKEYREYPNNPIDKEDWYYNKDNNCHRKRKAFVKGYTQCQQDMADKKYTEEDLINFAHLYFQENFNSTLQTCKSTQQILQQFINSLNKQD